MDLVARHPSDAYNLEAVPKCVEYLWATLHRYNHRRDKYLKL